MLDEKNKDLKQDYEENQLDDQIKEEEIDKKERLNIPPDAKWYVVHTQGGQEEKVKATLLKIIETRNLKDKIFRVVVPTEEEIVVRGGRRKVVKKKVFIGYVFIQMLMDDKLWYIVRNTTGITGFIGSSKPIPLTKDEETLIMQYVTGKVKKRRIAFAVGDKVRITDGPFLDFFGSVEEVDVDKAKLKVLISIFDRETPIELNFSQVEKIT